MSDQIGRIDERWRAGGFVVDLPPRGSWWLRHGSRSIAHLALSPSAGLGCSPSGRDPRRPEWGSTAGDRCGRATVDGDGGRPTDRLARVGARRPTGAGSAGSKLAGPKSASPRSFEPSAAGLGSCRPALASARAPVGLRSRRPGLPPPCSAHQSARACRSLMLWTIPSPRARLVSEAPPWVMKGRGIPVTGMMPTTMPMLTRT